MSTRRSALFFALVVAGYALIIPGQLATVQLDRALIWAAFNLGDTGRWVFNLTWPGFPPGAFMALSCIVVGTLLVAVAVGVASAPVAATPAIEPPGRSEVVSAWPVWGLLAAAAVLAAWTFHACRLEQPSNVAVVTWAASLVSGLLAFGWTDRLRGTSLGRPFDSHREVAVVALLTVLSLAAVTHDLMGWRWSGTPDESNFFGVAKALAQGTTERFLLSERGVFEVHPTLSSVYQSLFLMVLGPRGFAWRLSSAVALAAALPALYLLGRTLWNARVAAIATALFGTTPVAVGFAHLGYNNTQLYPVVVGALALAVWAHRYSSAAGFYLAGCIAGLGFYTYYPARLAPLLLLWLGVCAGAFAIARPERRRSAALLTGLLLAMVPAAAHPQETLTRMFQFTTFTGGGRERVTDLATAWQLIAAADYGELAKHTFMSLAYSVYFIGPHHFQWPPVVDMVSGPLVLVGLWLCIAGLRHRNARFVAGAYVLAALLIGGTSHYFRPPLTRLLFLSPFAALLAAVALDRLAAAASRATRSPRLGSALALTLTAAAVTWAIGSVQYNVRYRYHGYGDGTTAELVRLALEQPDDTAFIYVQRLDTSMWSVDEIFDEYGMKERLKYMRGFDDAARASLETAPPPFMAVLGLGSDAERLAAEAILTRRFPNYGWQSSDPAEHWNLRYFVALRH